jgi:hypothetical protein
MAFDPDRRLERWQFQQVGTQMGEPVYKRLRYNLVQYDDVPELYIEPVSMDEFGDTTESFQMRAQNAQQYPRIGGFDFHNGRPFPMFSYDDNVNLDPG